MATGGSIKWTYLDGNRPLRGEADVDGDGRIDRWEYFDADGKVSTIGSSSRGDGVEDTWTSPVATSAGETHIATSARRDRVRDRHAYYKEQTLLRVEEDTNGDGLINKWDRYEARRCAKSPLISRFQRAVPIAARCMTRRDGSPALRSTPMATAGLPAPGEPEKPRSSELNK